MEPGIVDRFVGQFPAIQVNQFARRPGFLGGDSPVAERLADPVAVLEVIYSSSRRFQDAIEA